MIGRPGASRRVGCRPVEKGLFLISRRGASVYNRKTMRILLLSLVVAFSASSCLRTSTEVRVKKDGSGSIVARYHFSPEMLAMLDQLGALGGAFGSLEGGAAGGPDIGLMRELAKPDEASLKADAAGYGEGVRYAKHEPGKDEEGWEGYSVVYEFDDVRKVRVDQRSMPGKARELVQSAHGELKSVESGGLSFGLEGDLLTVRSSFLEKGMDGLVDPKQIEQAKGMGMAPSEALKMGAGMAKGMRIGYFVRAEGGIAETDADHVAGDLIVISDADLSKVLLDPDLGAFADRVAADPSVATPEAYKEFIGKVEALTIEPKKEIKVRLK